MDAKQRASFINSIGSQPEDASGPKEAGFSISREGEEPGVAAVPFAAAAEPLTSLSDAAPQTAPAPQPAPASAFAAVEEKTAAPAAPAAPAEEKEEEANAFAQGLPDWDLVPPQLAVRKRRSV